MSIYLLDTSLTLWSSSSSSLAFQGHYSSGSGSCLSCHEGNSDFNFSAESSLKVSGEGSLSFPIGDGRNS